MKNIVSWSGGKDSTFMLHEMIRRGEHIDEVVCCDTTIEFPDMYIHQQKVVTNLSEHNIPFTFIKPEHDFEYYMYDYEKKRGSNAGSKGMGWSNPNYIWCRRFLKLGPINEYLNKKYGAGNYITNIGIAFDEIGRYEFDFMNCKKRYPLIEWKITELESIKGCHDLRYDWNGLYNRFYRVSCFCCPLQSIKELYMLYSFYPDLWQKLIDYDSRQTNRFRKDYTLQELEKRFSDLESCRDLMIEHYDN